MAEHSITARVPAHKAENTDLTIEVRSDKKLLGELIVHQGAIDWRPAYFKGGFRMKWEKFDDLMREKGSKLPG